MIQEGNLAPDFSLPDQDGIQRNLKDFLGKWLLLFFYPKDDTPGWTIEARAFGESLNQFEQAGAVVLGVSQDTVASHKKYRDKYGFGEVYWQILEGRCLKNMKASKNEKASWLTLMGLWWKSIKKLNLRIMHRRCWMTSSKSRRKTSRGLNPENPSIFYTSPFIETNHEKL